MSNPMRIKALPRNKTVSSRFPDPFLSSSVQCNKTVDVLEHFKTVVATVC